MTSGFATAAPCEIALALHAMVSAQRRLDVNYGVGFAACVFVRTSHATVSVRDDVKGSV